MRKINSLSDLLMEELADLLNAENQLVKVLPKMVEDSQSLALKDVLEDHLATVRGQVYRLHDIFSNIMQNPYRVTRKEMKGFITESEDAMAGMEKCPARDAVIISIVQRAENYEITKYKIAREHAADLGHTRMVELLSKTLNEERSIIFHLNELAQGMINTQAINPGPSHQQPDQPKEPASKTGSGGFYIPEGKFNRGGMKKKNKNMEVSRFISEGNPNIQEDSNKDKEKGQGENYEKQ